MSCYDYCLLQLGFYEGYSNEKMFVYIADDISLIQRFVLMSWWKHSEWLSWLSKGSGLLTCSCWASWFSSPSTIGANLSLLFLSAAIVIAARILSRLGGNRQQQGRGKHASQQTLLSPHRQDIYSLTSSNTKYLISPLMSVCTSTRSVFGIPDKGDRLF